MSESRESRIVDRKQKESRFIYSPFTIYHSLLSHHSLLITFLSVVLFFRGRNVAQGLAVLPPDEVDGYAREHDYESGPRRRRLIDKEHRQDYSSARDVKNRDERVSERLVRAIRIGTLLP